jgi:hypothetical protein
MNAGLIRLRPSSVLQVGDFRVYSHPGPLDPVPVAVLHVSDYLAVLLFANLPTLGRGLLDREAPYMTSEAELFRKRR